MDRNRPENYIIFFMGWGAIRWEYLSGKIVLEIGEGLEAELVFGYFPLRLHVVVVESTNQTAMYLEVVQVNPWWKKGFDVVS